MLFKHTYLSILFSFSHSNKRTGQYDRQFYFPGWTVAAIRGCGRKVECLTVITEEKWNKKNVKESLHFSNQGLKACDHLV